MDPVTVGALIYGGAQVLGSLFNYGAQSSANKINKQLNWSQFNYQKQLNNLVMEREDNAVQRRAADLAQAGINPNLAAGSPASASSLTAAGHTKIDAAQLDLPNIANNIIAFQQARAAQLEYKQFEFETKVDQIFSSGSDPKQFFVDSDFNIYSKDECQSHQEATFEDGSFKTVLWWTHNGKPVEKLDTTPAWHALTKRWQIFKNQEMISNNDVKISDNDREMSNYAREMRAYDQEMYKVDRWIDRVSTGLDSVTGLGRFIGNTVKGFFDSKTNRINAETRRQNAGRSYTESETYTRNKNGYTRSRSRSY